MQLSYIAIEADNGKKVGDVLRKNFGISSRLLNKLKMNEKIVVNCMPVFSSYILKINDVIEINIDFEEKDGITAQEIELDILYEDEFLLAVNKKANMCVHPSAYHPDSTLANGVKFYLNNNKKIRPINRLDRDTSGIVLFAKNEYIQELMANNDTVCKEYLAIAEGIFEIKKGIINKPIARKDGSIMEREINDNGQKAVTHYEVINELLDKNLSIVKLRLETRPHTPNTSTLSID